jgi:hypothetical protein
MNGLTVAIKVQQKCRPKDTEEEKNKMKKLVSFMGLVALAGSAQLGQAALQIAWDIDGAAPGGSGVMICAVATGCVATFDGVTISDISIASNSPGSAGLAQQFGDTLQISSTGASTIELWLSASGFMLPTTPPPVLYSAGLSTTSTTGMGTTAMTSCIDGANALVAPPAVAFCGVKEGQLVNVGQSYSGSSSTSGTVSTNVSSLSVPYSLEQEITLTVGANSNLNVITSQVLTPVPEPMSIVLLGGVILLSSGAIRRKRKQEASRV